MLRLILAAFLFFFPVMANAGDLLPETKAGTWHGVGVQTDMFVWSMEVVFNGLQKAEVFYIGSECGGVWHYLSANEDRIMASEEITYGQDFCISGGWVWIDSLEDNLLIYRWFDTEGTLFAVAVLWEGSMRNENYDALLDFTLDTLEHELGSSYEKNSSYEINRI